MDKQANDNSRKDCESKSAAGDSAVQTGWRKHLPAGAVAAVVLTALVANCTKIWNDDDPWHLAGGQRMLQNLSVATTDTFAYPYYDTNPQRIWINVHWLFQVAVASVHGIGEHLSTFLGLAKTGDWHTQPDEYGYKMLSIFKALMGGLVLLIFGLTLYRRVPAAWLVVCGLLMIHYMALRLRIRPEMFSFVYLMLTISILDGVAAGRPAKLLWWMVPIQLVWVNMHALYVLGIGLMWSSLIFAFVEKYLGRTKEEIQPVASGGTASKRPVTVTVGMAGNLASSGAVVAVIAATVVCLVSPWPIEGPMQAFLLHQDISGRSEYLTYGISEFLPLWDSWSAYTGVVVLGAAVLFAFGFLAVLEVLKLSRPRLPLRHVVWMVAFVYLAGTARRNVALLGPLLCYLLALHGGQMFTMIAAARPRLARIRHWLAVAAIAAAIVIAALYVPRPWQWFNPEEQVGLGRQDAKYPIETAEFLGKLPAPGVLLCDDFGTASTYIFYGGPRNNPHRLVYMDGRVGLKVHTLDRFIEYTDLFHAMRKITTAREMKLPDCVRFISVQCDNKEHLAAMSACTDRFRLIYIDPVGAGFVRLDWPGGDPLEGIPERSNISQYDKPLDSDGFVQGVPHVRRIFFLPKPFSLSSRLGEVFLTLGTNPEGAGPLKANPVKQCALLMATRYFMAGVNEGVTSRDLLAASMAQAFQQLDLLMQTAGGLDLSSARPREAESPSSLPIHFDAARALYLYDSLDWSKIDQVDVKSILVQQVRTMLQAGMVDCAEATMSSANKRLSGFWRVNPPQMYVDLDNRIKTLVDQNRVEEARMNLQALPLMERVKILASPRLGMTDQAIAELRAADSRDAQAEIVLGDLLLNKGLSGQARECYARATRQQSMKDQVALRLALCDWVEGNYYAAVDSLDKLPGDGNLPLAGYYRACMLIRLGLYDRARKALSEISLDGAPDDLRMAIEFMKTQVKEFQQ